MPIHRAGIRIETKTQEYVGFNMSTYQTSKTLIDKLCHNGQFHDSPLTLQMIETHISWLILGQEYVWKFKKPVNFGFLDFSTLEKRRFFCEEELRLNQRFAPEIYLSVVSINYTPDGPMINAEGPALEYAVKMRRFPDKCLLQDLLDAGKLHTEVIEQLASVVADFHKNNTPLDPDRHYSGPQQISHWFEENIEKIQPLLNTQSHIKQIQLLQTWGNGKIQQLQTLIEQRRNHGFIRECHGDLHLGNVAFINGKVTLFDCIEFNPELRWIDVISEIAFLVMDLLQQKQRLLAYRFLNRYLQLTGDYDGIPLLKYYLIYRALVRAKVAVLRLHQSDEWQKRSIIDQYQSYADLATSIVKTYRPVLILTHGYSGSGKSTYAKALACAIGALHIRSDIERKRLSDLEELANSHSVAGGGIYTRQKTRATYQSLGRIAETILNSGFSVIVDATFVEEKQRNIFHRIAENCGADYRILSLEAPVSVLENRINQRLSDKKDASEADTEILHRQIRTADPLNVDELEHTLAIDTTSIGPYEDTLVRRLKRYMTPF